jgi:hypothetical protein
MKSLRFLLPIFLLIAGLFAAAQPAAPGRPGAEKADANAILPTAFGGWQIVDQVKMSRDANAADPTSVAVLKEYGFTDFAGATYTRDDGRKLTLKAARFADASGAYGAFTFYKTPVMLNEKIGDQGYSLNNRILFYKGNIVVDAVFQQLSAMSAAELRELADGLPRPRGTTANLPGLPAYLPKISYVKNTARYVVGPTALEKVEAPIPAQFVDFSKGAEVVLGDYNLSGAAATLTLISYPTPQIAASQLKAIEAAEQAHQLAVAPIATRRTGPIVAIMTGSASPGDAKSLLSVINYDADVTWNQNTYFTRRDNVANLIVGVIILAGIILGMSIVAGIAFGGFRVAIKRFFPDKVFDRPEQMEIIALHLTDPGEKSRELF